MTAATATRVTCTACQYEVSSHLSTAGLCQRKACVKARTPAAATAPAVPVQPAATQAVPAAPVQTVQAPTPEPAKADVLDCACCCEPTVAAIMVTDEDGCLVCPPCRHNGYDCPDDAPAPVPQPHAGKRVQITATPHQQPTTAPTGTPQEQGMTDYRTLPAYHAATPAQRAKLDEVMASEDYDAAEVCSMMAQGIPGVVGAFTDHLIDQADPVALMRGEAPTAADEPQPDECCYYCRRYYPAGGVVDEACPRCVETEGAEWWKDEPTAASAEPVAPTVIATPDAPHCPHQPDDVRCDHHRPARQCVYCLAALEATYAADSTVTPVVTPPTATINEPQYHNHKTQCDWVPYTREVYGYLIDTPQYADRVKPVLPVAYPPKAWELPGTNAHKVNADLAGAPGAAYCDMTGTATPDEVMQALRFSNLRVSNTCSLTGSNHYAMTVSYGLAEGLVAAGLARHEDMHRTGRHRRSVVIATADRAEARDGYLEGADNEAAVKYGDDNTPVKVRYKGEVVEVTRAVARVMAEQVKDAKRSSKRGRKAKADAAARGWQIDDSNTRVTGDHTLERWLVITEAGRRHVDALDEAKATQQQREAATQMAKTTGKTAAHGLSEEQAAKVRWYDLTTPAGRRHWEKASPSMVTRLCDLMGRDWLPAVVGKRRESPAEHYARVEGLLAYYADQLRATGKRGQSSKPVAPAVSPRTPQPKEMFVPAPQPGPGLSALAKATKADEPQPTLPGERIVVLRGANGDVPTVSQPKVYAALNWTVTVKGGTFGIPFVRADGEESFMVLGYRRTATAVAWGDEASGMADYWRLSQLERKNGDRGDLTLHYSYSGDAGTWVKAGTLTEAEAVAWLDGRSGGRGKALLAALLAS